MDTLFTTTVIINGEPQEYKVTFADDVYQFQPDGNNEAPAFALRRAEDTWKLEGELNEIEKGQAISALEHYLLSQH